MEDICETCKKPAEVSCYCNNSLRLCLKDYLFIHKEIIGDHKPIDLAQRRQEFKQKFIPTIENLYKIKSQIISKSSQLIQIIQLIATKKLSIIKKLIIGCESTSKAWDFDTEKSLKNYQNIETRETDLEMFIKIANDYFSIFKDDNEIIDPELEKALLETKQNKKVLKHNSNQALIVCCKDIFLLC